MLPYVSFQVLTLDIHKDYSNCTVETMRNILINNSQEIRIGENIYSKNDYLIKQIRREILIHNIKKNTDNINNVMTRFSRFLKGQYFSFLYLDRSLPHCVIK